MVHAVHEGYIAKLLLVRKIYSPNLYCDQAFVTRSSALDSSAFVMLLYEVNFGYLRKKVNEYVENLHNTLPFKSIRIKAKLRIVLVQIFYN